jgi:STE24 endopeptidase
MSNKSLLLSVGILSAVLVVLIGLFTPWQVLPISIHPLPASSDFSPADIARAKSFHASLIPLGVGAWALGFLLAGVAGFTSIGSRLVGFLPGPFYVRAFLGVLVIELAINLIELPLDMRRERLFRTYSLSTQDWRSWSLDRIQHFAIGTSLTAASLTALVLCVRMLGQRWWIAGGAGVALLVIVVSFGYPLFIEPIFNKFTPMTASPLRDELMGMAANDGVPVKQILIADASRRTTALNAYVSGFGATRRIVLYDVLLKNASPEEVKLVVAHELGHAKNNDVGRFTLVGALASALGVLLLGLLVKWKPLLHRAGLPRTQNPLADPRSVALVLALIAMVTLLQQPVSSLLSRTIEAHADVHALNLTNDPQHFVQMQRTLSISNIADPDPSNWIFWLFANHPTPPQRIAIARAFARLHHQTEPPLLTSG